MKKLLGFLLVLAFITITSCSVRDVDNRACMSTVEAHFPEAKVYSLPDEQYRYIVVDTCGSVMYVAVMGSWDEITSINVLHSCK